MAMRFRDLFVLTGVTIVLIIITLYFASIQTHDTNEVIHENYSGYFVYNFVSPAKRKDSDEAKKLIEVFENVAPEYIYSSLKELDYCSDEVKKHLIEYKRFYKLWRGEQSDKMTVIFTYPDPMYEMNYEAGQDPTYVDGGISQFRVTYDFSERVFSKFSVNFGGYGCSPLVENST